jgi:asparaginyl-tRNA synthetase
MEVLRPEHRIKNLLERTDSGAEVVLHGWVRTRRDSKGGFSFIELNDGSSLKGIQVVADSDLANYDAEIVQLGTGCSIRVRGKLQESPGKGQTVEVHASRIEVLGWVEDPETYPLQKKRHSMEFLREVAHLRPRSNTFGAVGRVRNCLAMATHRFFQEREFLYLHTPIITSSDCEGAGALFRVSAEGPAEPGESTSEFFGRAAYLTVSGQLAAENYACSLTNVYTFGPAFRAENSNTSRHLAEFWMIEPEMAFCDLGGTIDLAEAYIKYIFTAVLEECPEDMAFFNQWVEKQAIATLEQVVGSNFERMTYTEAVEILERSGESFEFPVKWGSDLQSEHERFLSEKHVQCPVVVTDYPRGLKAFYMRRNDDGKTVAAMDVLVPRIGEIVGGAQREERTDVLRERMTEAGLPEQEYWWYLDLRKYGTVPHAGFGLGFERTIQFATGMANIRDVIPFPRTPGSMEF